MPIPYHSGEENRETTVLVENDESQCIYVLNS